MGVCLLVKVQKTACLCLLACVCAYVPVCVSEPAVWISAVGHSRDEQSRIKSILVLARREPVLLLGDTATEGEEKREQILLLLLLLLLLLSSLPSHCCALQLLLLTPLFFTACLLFFSPSLSCVMLPSLSPLSLSTVAAPYLSPFSLPRPLCHSKELLAQGNGRRSFVQFKAVSEIAASSRRFIKNTFSIEELVHLLGGGNWTDCSLDTDF